jgi:hypothetical protein
VPILVPAASFVSKNFEGYALLHSYFLAKINLNKIMGRAKHQEKVPKTQISVYQEKSFHSKIFACASIDSEFQIGILLPPLRCVYPGDAVPDSMIMSKKRVLIPNIIHVQCLPKWRKLVPGVCLRANKLCCLGRCSRSGRYATLRNIGLAIWEAGAMINLMRQSVRRDTP